MTLDSGRICYDPMIISGKLNRIVIFTRAFEEAKYTVECLSH